MSWKDIRTHLPATFEGIPDDRTMAAKYFLDIMNDGTPAMVDGTRKILKAIWMRMTAGADISNADLGEAIGESFHIVNTEDIHDDKTIEGRTERQGA